MSSGIRSHGQLKRSRSDRVIGGVCGGLAHYLDLDPVVVRLAFVVMALLQGAGLLLYLILLIVLPEEDRTEVAEPQGPPSAEPRRRRGALAGVLLVGLGAYLLVVNLGLFWWWDWKFGGPALLIAAGLGLLFWRLR